MAVLDMGRPTDHYSPVFCPQLHAFARTVRMPEPAVCPNQLSSPIRTNPADGLDQGGRGNAAR